MANTKIVALFGESGTGKDTLFKYIKNIHPNDFNFILNCTTRPMRHNEMDMVDYEFLSKKDFIQKTQKHIIVNITKFNNWYYGVDARSIKSDKINIGIFNPKNISFFLENTNYKIYPLRIIAEDKTRLNRSLNRELNPNCHEICRRFLADYEDFQNIPFEYVIFDNNDIFYSNTNAGEQLIKAINYLTKEN